MRVSTSASMIDERSSVLPAGVEYVWTSLESVRQHGYAPHQGDSRRQGVQTASNAWACYFFFSSDYSLITSLAREVSESI